MRFMGTRRSMPGKILSGDRAWIKFSMAPERKRAAEGWAVEHGLTLAGFLNLCVQEKLDTERQKKEVLDKIVKQALPELMASDGALSEGLESALTAVAEAMKSQMKGGQKPRK